jgi:hypothetical protein
MTTDTTRTRKFRVLYAVTRGEYYEVEAANAEEAIERAFGDGTLVEQGETTDVTDCEVEEVPCAESTRRRARR